MGGLSASVSTEVAAHYGATRFTRIVDVGGSQGTLLAGLLEAVPQATGVLFDRPEVIAARGLAERVDFVGGDFFTEVPAGGDLYVLTSVLHDWNDTDALRILANCHRAAQPGSMLLVEGLGPTEPGHPRYIDGLFLHWQSVVASPDGKTLLNEPAFLRGWPTLSRSVLVRRAQHHQRDRDAQTQRPDRRGSGHERLRGLTVAALDAAQCYRYPGYQDDQDDLGAS